MKKWMVEISKEILLQKQDAHIIDYKLFHMQERLNEAFRKDTSHTKRLAE